MYAPPAQVVLSPASVLPQRVPFVLQGSTLAPQPVPVPRAPMELFNKQQGQVPAYSVLQAHRLIPRPLTAQPVRQVLLQQLLGLPHARPVMQGTTQNMLPIARPVLQGPLQTFPALLVAQAVKLALLLRQPVQSTAVHVLP